MGKFKMPRQIKEAKMTILKLIKVSYKYDNTLKTKNIQKTGKKQSRYFTRFHKGSNKGQGGSIKININNRRIKILQENTASSSYK